MAFNEQLPQWENEGTQPPQSKRVEGWLPNEKPPASWFNWLFHRTYKSLQELQEKAGERVDVEQALQTADDAQATANEANQKAEQAQQTADNAQATADEANQKADQNAADLITHLNENATEAHDGISILNDNITVTVGNNGDFSTINEALNYLTTKYPAYKSVGNVKATIKLLSGFVMSEQVLVRGLNLGWIEIVGEDAVTTIERSALTSNFTIDDYNFNSYPAFGVSKGGILPIVGQLFVMDDSGNSTNRHGIMAVDNSRASILTGCGVQNAGSFGIYANRASVINAWGADASGAGGHGVFANQASIINAVNANASNAGNQGIYTNQASVINAWGADASGAGGHGVFANQASIINAIAANARKGEVDSAEDVYVNNGSIIRITLTGDNQTIGGTNQAINTLTGNGIIFG